MKKIAATPQNNHKRLSRRDLLKLLGGASGALFTGLALSPRLTALAQSVADQYSHSNDTDPDYGIAFPSDIVNSILITMSPENWQAVQDDLTGLLGAFGSRPGGNNGAFAGGQPPANADGRPPMGGEQPPMEGGQPPMAGTNGFAGVIDFLETDPIWIPITVTFNDETWENVGFRFKGNSTLQGAWTGGSLKMGFKLNFDKYEDDFPEIKNQRFFGFDEISFSSNFRDSSYLRERIAADIFRDAGIPSARTAFYAVSFDYGEGAQYIGVYTAVEEVEDAVLDTQFSSDEGNLYKPEGTGATFAAGTFDEASFEKKTNEKESDFSDILALFAALHAETRITDPQAWRTGLESVLDVDGFIHWLAVNTVIQNWDTYGTMPHNFYLYNNPDTGLLTWIPWDNNEALSGGGRGNNNSLDLTTTTDDWPLISFLMNDPVYHALYVDYVRQTMNTVFEPERMTPIYETQHALIAPYVNGTATGSADVNFVSQDGFDEALIQLIAHVNQRYALAQAYIDRQ